MNTTGDIGGTHESRIEDGDFMSTHRTTGVVKIRTFPTMPPGWFERCRATNQRLAELGRRPACPVCGAMPGEHCVRLAHEIGR